MLQSWSPGGGKMLEDDRKARTSHQEQGCKSLGEKDHVDAQGKEAGRS